MNPLRIHLTINRNGYFMGCILALGRVVAQAMPTFVASSLRFFFAIIPLMIWLYAANRFKYAKQLRANQWIGLFVTAFFGVLPIPRFYLGTEISSCRASSRYCGNKPSFHDAFGNFYLKKNGIDG